jgi:hypothetical protein
MASTVSHQLPSAQAQAIADLTGYEDAATLRWQQACVQAANTLTALPNGRYVNVRMERMRQGLELAQRGAVSLPDDGQDLSAVVRSGNNLYQIDTRLLTCTCADYQKHLQACKHLLATEIHTGALGLSGLAEEPLNPPAPEPALNTSLPAPAPTTASWPTSEAPASFNVKLRGSNYELMYTVRDVSDQAIVDRIPTFPQWVQKLLITVAADMKKAAESPAQPPTPTLPAPERTLEEQIAAAVQAALKAQTPPTNPNGQRQPPPRDPMLEPTNDTDPSWCPIHRCKMERRSNDRGSWYSHRLSSGAYCKGE